jgi:hypothetical protein
MRPKTGILLRNDSAVGTNPAKSSQNPYVSTTIPKIAHPQTTSPTPAMKNMVPWMQKVLS